MNTVHPIGSECVQTAWCRLHVLLSLLFFFYSTVLSSPPLRLPIFVPLISHLLLSFRFSSLVLFLSCLSYRLLQHLSGPLTHFIHDPTPSAVTSACHFSLLPPCFYRSSCSKLCLSSPPHFSDIYASPRISLPTCISPPHIFPPLLPFVVVIRSNVAYILQHWL